METDTPGPGETGPVLAQALVRVAKGDREALHLIHDLTVAKLFSICLRISHDRMVTEDILQSVYLDIWHRAGDFDPKAASPMAWLSRIARDTATGAVAAKTARPEHPLPPVMPVLDPQTLTRSRERVMARLDQLDDRSRGAIRAALHDPLPYSGLAERMALPLATLKRRIRRGLAGLRGAGRS